MPETAGPSSLAAQALSFAHDLLWVRTRLCSPPGWPSSRKNTPMQLPHTALSRTTPCAEWRTKIPNSLLNEMLCAIT